MAFNLNNRNNFRNNRRLLSEINVTPFVDVMLVLLIVFMVTSPMLVAGVDVDLPETKASQVKGDDVPLTITVTANGEIFLAETKIERDNLAAKLNAVTTHNKEARIFVRGDKNASYGQIMEVVGEINHIGFKKVALITNINSK